MTSECLLVTMDVNSLYTNIPHSDGVEACRSFLTMNTTDQTLINDIPTLVDFILTHNLFVFDNKQYLLINGTAMGTKMAPTYADIFMYYVENTFHSSFHSFHSFIPSLSPLHKLSSNAHEKFYDCFTASQIHRICSDRKDFIKHSEELVTHFLRIGYPIKVILKQWDKVHRSSMFTHGEKTIDNHIPLVQTYHPTIVSANKSVIKEWKLQQYQLSETFIL